ncbi:SIR2-domain-containing protein [Marasmius fiardii PR-910]|nr:SIR2-domain-containing protein [Marasmius fiardii PR-910]
MSGPSQAFQLKGQSHLTGTLSPDIVHSQDSTTVATANTINPHKPSQALLGASPVDLLFFQTRAFLEATEDVDAEPETIQELIQLLTGKESDPENEASEALEVAPNDLDDDDEEYDPEKDFELQELDISALFTRKDDSTWTKTEIKSMMHDLKEKGSEYFVKHYVVLLGVPIPKLLLAFGVNLCPELLNVSGPTLRYFLRVAMFRELRLRERLAQYSTISDAVNLIRNSKRILILTGAGVSCGIPDFRSRNGLYASLGEYDLDDPQQMFDITYFRENPSGVHLSFFQIYPSNFVPSPCHRFIKLVESQDKLLRNYTQNIDTLEVAAGVQRVIQCHGSFASASCLQCRRRVPGKEIEAEILTRRVPLCAVCNAREAPPKKSKKSKKKAKGEWDSDEEDESDGPTYPPGIMKPDITFFGEKLSDDFDTSLEQDRYNVDLLLVIGTSLKVAPVADILSHLPHSVPQILINKTPIRHINPDIVLLGNADDIVMHLCEQLGWELPPRGPTPPIPVLSGRLQPPRGNGNIKKRVSEELLESEPPRRVGDSHVWLFPGAEGGKWLSDLEKEAERRTREIKGASLSNGVGTSSVPQTRGPSPTSRSGSLAREVKKARIT